MYKVFVNEKRLSISKSTTNAEKNIRYEDPTSLEIALDLLENTSCPEINVYGTSETKIWNAFTQLFRVVEAAGGIVYNPENKILFIHRLGKWDLPKGKLEPNEFLKEAAVREVEEETGLKQIILEDFVNNTYHVYHEKRNGKDEKILKSTYWFKMKYVGQETLKPQIEEGITEVCWKSKEVIKTEVFPNTFQNIKLILEEVL